MLRGVLCGQLDVRRLSRSWYAERGGRLGVVGVVRVGWRADVVLSMPMGV